LCEQFGQRRRVIGSRSHLFPTFVQAHEYTAYVGTFKFEAVQKVIGKIGHSANT
jgi:hypothetical protein